MDELDKLLAPAGGDELDTLLGIPPVGGIRPPKEQGGFIASAKQSIGATIKGAGQLAADIGLGGQDNALKQYGQEVIEANPTAVKGLSDIVDKPLTTVTEATGNAAGSLGTMLGIRAVGQGITAAAPLTGVAAPIVAGAGQLISWAGPAAVAALPSFGGIREKQIEKDPEAATSWTDKAIAALGAGTVGLIETKFGPQDWALKLATEAGRKQLSGMLASETIKGAIGKGAVKGALIEGGEELVQNPVEQLASGDNPLTPTSLEETAFGGVMGAVGGGVLGGGLGPALRAKAEPSPKGDEVDQTTNVVQQAALNGATPDEVKIDKVEGKTATVTVGDRTVELPIKEAAEAVATGKLEEVLAEKEALPPVEELPAQPGSPTTIFLRQNGEARGFLPPTGKTIEQVREETAEMTPRQKLDYFKENKASNYRYKLLDEAPNAEEIRKSAQANRPGEGVQGQEAGPVRVRRDDELGLAEEGRQEVGGQNDSIQLDQAAVADTTAIPQGPGSMAAPGRGIAPAGGSALGVEQEADRRTTAGLGGQQDVTLQQNPPAVAGADTQQAGAGVPGTTEGNIGASEVATRQGAETKGPIAPLFSFAGQKAKNAPSIIEARTLQTAGETPQQVWDKTGWWELAPGQWSFEIDDSLSDVKMKNGKLNTVLQQKQLFANYPELSQVEVEFKDLGDKKRGSYTPKTNKITINSNFSSKAQRSTLHHEVQHIIQQMEGFAPGFSMREAPGEAPQDYWRKTGEVEARLTQTRLNMTPAQRKATPPWATLQQMLTREGLLKEGQTVADVLMAQGEAKGSTFVKQVEKELKAFLGRGYDTLVRRGKLEVVRNANEIGELGEPLRTTSGVVAGSYFPSQKKVVLFSDNMEPGSAEDLMRHEAVHALLQEDKLFRTQKTRILKDFAILARNNPAIKAAFAKVPTDTAKGFRGEEALAYFLQDSKNRQHSLFKRVLSAIKAALYRLGLGYGKFSESDLVALFSQGTKAWARREADQQPTRGLDEILNQPEQLFSQVSNNLQAGNQEVNKAAKILNDIRSPLHDLYIRFAPQWLSVMPISHLAQTFGKKIQWLKDIDRHNGLMEAIKAQLPDDFYAIYQDAERIANKNSGLKAFNDLLLVGTFNQMTPWADLEDQDWVPASHPAAPSMEMRLKEAEQLWKSEGMKESTGKTFKEAFAETKKAWDKLKPAEQEQAKKIVGYLQSLRERERNNLLATIEAASQGNKELYKEMMDRFNATFSRIRGIYVPLSRYGDYILKFTLPDGREQVDHFNTPGERRAFRKQMEKDGVDPNTFVEDVKRESVKGEAVIPQALREQLMKAMEAKHLVGVNPEDAQAVAEARGRALSAVSDLDQVLLRWMPETSALKNSIHRKNVLGANTDMLRSSMDYVLRHAGSIAWMEVGREIDKDIQNFEEENKELAKDAPTNIDLRRHILNNVRRWNQAIRNETVGPIASTLGKFSTAYFMTSPSTFLVQLTQLPVLTLPAMAVKYKSWAKATAALSEGLQKAFNKKYNKDAMYGDEKVNEVYAALHRRVTEQDRVGDQQIGQDWFTPQEKLAKIAGLGEYQKELLALREALAMNMLDISAVHEASDIAQGKQTTYFGKAMRYAMLPMQHGELGSRKATVLANFKLATEQKKDFFSALEDASEVVGGTLYNYAKSDKGWFLQGGLARTVTTFQTYRIKTALRMGILLMQSLKGETKEVRRAALKEFIGVTGMSAALAGVHGTVIGSLIFGLANLFGGDDDEPYDASLVFDNWLTEQTGETAAMALSYGLPNLFGANLSKRIGMADLYGTQSEPPENLHGAPLAAWWAGNLIGPSFSVAQSWVKGYDQMVNKGNYMRGLEEALPKPLKDGLKAIRVATEGLKTGAGKKLISDEEIGPDEIVMMAIGFNPDEIAKAQGAERTLNKMGTKLTERRGRLIKNAARAIVESEDTTEAMEAIRVFNSKLPLFAIGGRDIKPAVRRLVLGEMGTTGIRQRRVASQFGIDVYEGE